MTMHLPDLRSGYVALVDHVRLRGQPSSPRGLPIREVENFTFTVANLRDTLPIGVGRLPSTQLAAIEALQLIGGVSTPGLLVAAAPQFAEYREPEGYFHGAYGPRVESQVAEVLRKLDEDHDTRQAVITIWDPAEDNLLGKRDYPCTVALGFRLRRDRLNLSVVMRSNDAWLGVPYDVFQFSQLQWSVAERLGVEPGTYTHTAWSMHLYERDLERAEQLYPPKTQQPRLPTGVDELTAVELLFHPHLVSLDGRTLDVDSVRWYHERMTQAHAKLHGDG